MKPIVLPILAVFTIFVSGFLPLRDAAAEDKTCVFKADAKKVHITVWDEDSEEERQGKVPPAVLFSAINWPVMIGLMVTTIGPAKAVIPSGYPDILRQHLRARIELSHLP